MSVVLAGNPPAKRSVGMSTHTAIVPFFLIDLIRPRPPYNSVAVDFALSSIEKICTELLTKALEYFLAASAGS